MILRWKDTSNENLTFTLRYKQDNDEHWKESRLRNVCKNDNLREYRVEHTVENPKPGNCVCQIQSKCESGVSEMSMAKLVCKEEKVGFVTVLLLSLSGNI